MNALADSAHGDRFDASGMIQLRNIQRKLFAWRGIAHSLPCLDKPSRGALVLRTFINRRDAEIATNTHVIFPAHLYRMLNVLDHESRIAGSLYVEKRHEINASNATLICHGPQLGVVLIAGMRVYGIAPDVR